MTKWIPSTVLFLAVIAVGGWVAASNAAPADVPGVIAMQCGGGGCGYLESPPAELAPPADEALACGCSEKTAGCCAEGCAAQCEQAEACACEANACAKQKSCAGGAG